MTRTGGLVLAVTIALQAALAQMAVAAQPKNVMTRGHGRFALSQLRIRMAGHRAAAGAAGPCRCAVKRANALACHLPRPPFAFLNVVSTVMVRDGVRDVTLRIAGFDVWDQPVDANWSVIDLFLVLLVAALAVIVAWLVGVLAKPPQTRRARQELRKAMSDSTLPVIRTIAGRRRSPPAAACCNSASPSPGLLRRSHRLSRCIDIWRRPRAAPIWPRAKSPP